MQVRTRSKSRWMTVQQLENWNSPSSTRIEEASSNKERRAYQYCDVLGGYNTGFEDVREGYAGQGGGGKLSGGP